MSMMDIKANMHKRIDDLFASICGNASDGDCKSALKAFQLAHYSDLASLSFWLGCDSSVFEREAVPASEIADEAFFEIDREREFECPAFIPVYSTLNHAQQGIAR